MVARVIARLNVGGPALHVTHLAEGLAARYPTILITGQVGPGEGDLLPEVRRKGLPLLEIPELGRSVRPWHDAIALAKLVLLFRRVRPAIVHTHTAKAGTLGRIAAGIAGVPIRVHTFHGHVLRGYFSPAVTRAVIQTERTLARVTTRAVTVSEGLADELANEFRICRREKIEVIPLGLDLARFAPNVIERYRGELRRELGLGNKPIVAIVGRLVPIKNHALFLRAAAAVLGAGRRAAFVIVGGGKEEHRLRAIAAELGIAGSVHFLGWRSDLERIYADADVVALTSDNEGTPVSVIEALAAGRAVVATDVGGVREVLSGGRLGLLVPAGDAARLARSIERLLHDPSESARVGAIASGEIPSRYGKERLLRDVSALYDRLLVESGRQPPD